MSHLSQRADEKGQPLASRTRIRLVAASDWHASEAAAQLGADFALVHDWLRRYVSKPDAALGRTGPVCPFVPLAMKEHAIEYVFRYDVYASNAEHAREVLHAEINEFGATAAVDDESGHALDSRLIVMPHAQETGWLDSIYESMKSYAVNAYLMIGQFHANCEVRAVRNVAFQVSRAPITMVAVRRMAAHDVLFLHSRQDWFARYREKFAALMEGGRIRDDEMRRLYSEALLAHEQLFKKLDD